MADATIPRTHENAKFAIPVDLVCVKLGLC